MNDKATSKLVQQWKRGDQDAATALFERYVERLTRLVEARLSTKLNARLDSDDIAQSALKSMLIRVRDGRFEFGDDRAFWQLLVTIAVNKVRNKVRFAKAAKRDITRESASGGEDSYEKYVANCLSSAPTSEAVVAFEEILDWLFKNLPHREARVLELRMEGKTQIEIARELEMSDRQVRRDLDRLRERLREMFEIGEVPDNR